MQWLTVEKAKTSLTSMLMKWEEKETRGIFSVLKNSHLSPSLINGTILAVPIPLNESGPSYNLCAQLYSKSSERMFPLSEWLQKPTQEPETLDLTLKEMSEPLVD